MTDIQRRTQPNNGRLELDFRTNIVPSPQQQKQW